MIYITHNLVGTKTKPPTVSDIRITPKTGKGSLPAILKFYAWADDNHMPLKKITIDWGDGQSIVSGGPESYYKNRKDACAMRCDGGVNDGNICTKKVNCIDGDCRLHFGDSKDACEPKAFEFSHVYGCTAGQLELLDACSATVTTNCSNGTACVYKPKVQVLDNWGWCNGRCVSGGGKGCYDGSENKEFPVAERKDKCDTDYEYPHWTEFGGNIIVAP